MKAIRGAVSVPTDTVNDMEEATQSLLRELTRRNDLEISDVVCVFFTLTPDLCADFPARSARAIGWDVPMLDMQEVPVPGALMRCIRVLVLTNLERPVRHVYLGEARSLRPDLEDEE